MWKFQNLSISIKFSLQNPNTHNPSYSILGHICRAFKKELELVVKSVIENALKYQFLNSDQANI